MVVGGLRSVQSICQGLITPKEVETADTMQVEWIPASQGENVAVTVPTLNNLLVDLKRHFQEREGFCLATLNLDHVVKLRSDDAFRKAYAAHSHITADGNPIVWLCKLARRPVSLLSGADLIAPLAQLAGSMNVPVALLGSDEETLRTAAGKLEAQHEGLSVVACIAPPFGFDPESALAETYIAQLQEADVGLCFVALGAPKQEIFASHATEAASRIGFVSIGAGIDFIAGTQTRAPAFMRLIAAEWLWRLATNPKRFAGRYAACFLVLPSLLVSALKARRANGHGKAQS